MNFHHQQQLQANQSQNRESSPGLEVCSDNTAGVAALVSASCVNHPTATTQDASMGASSEARCSTAALMLERPSNLALQHQRRGDFPRRNSHCLSGIGEQQQNDTAAWWLQRVAPPHQTTGQHQNLLLLQHHQQQQSNQSKHNSVLYNQASLVMRRNPQHDSNLVSSLDFMMPHSARTNRTGFTPMSDIASPSCSASNSTAGNYMHPHSAQSQQKPFVAFNSIPSLDQFPSDAAATAASASSPSISSQHPRPHQIQLQMQHLAHHHGSFLDKKFSFNCPPAPLSLAHTSGDNEYITSGADLTPTQVPSSAVVTPPPPLYRRFLSTQTVPHQTQPQQHQSPSFSHGAPQPSRNYNQRSSALLDLHHQIMSHTHTTHRAVAGSPANTNAKTRSEHESRLHTNLQHQHSDTADQMISSNNNSNAADAAVLECRSPSQHSFPVFQRLQSEIQSAVHPNMLHHQTVQSSSQSVPLRMNLQQNLLPLETSSSGLGLDVSTSASSSSQPQQDQYQQQQQQDQSTMLLVRELKMRLKQRSAELKYQSDIIGRLNHELRMKNQVIEDLERELDWVLRNDYPENTSESHGQQQKQTYCQSKHRKNLETHDKGLAVRQISFSSNSKFRESTLDDAVISYHHHNSHNHQQNHQHHHPQQQHHLASRRLPHPPPQSGDASPQSTDIMQYVSLHPPSPHYHQQQKKRNSQPHQPRTAHPMMKHSTAGAPQQSLCKTGSIINCNNSKFRKKIPRSKRMAISGESSKSIYTNHKKPKHVAKSERTKALIRHAILNNDFLRHLNRNQIGELVEFMYPVLIERASCIIQEGEIGCVLYVLEEGVLEVSRHGERIRQMTDGTVFGELAILYNCTRTASVRALTNCKLWAIERQSFQAIMMKSGLRMQQEYMRFLKSVPTFKDLNNEVLCKIADVLEENHYEKGDYIIREGAKGDTFYIISKGKVKVTKRGGSAPNQEETFIRFLERGDFFGEKALRDEDVRTASIVAVDDDGVNCLVLDRESYNSLIGDSGLLNRQYPDEIEKKENAQNFMRNRRFAHILLKDIQIVAIIGVGGFGKVELVKINNVEEESFALKKLSKRHIIATGQQEHLISERDILLQSNSHFIVKLYKTFKDKAFIYLLMEVCLGGEVWTLLRERSCFNEETTRFYIACVVSGLNYLHTRGIVFRDLKPENLLLDTAGYCKLTDFGFAKKIGHSQKTWTFCGTPEYVAPEIILNKGHEISVDIWSLGILLFELLTGLPPFTANDPMKTYNIILKGIDAIDFPAKITKNATNLIKKLCRDIATERLGFGKAGILSVQKHVWFEGFNWEGINNRTLAPPIQPKISSIVDVSNFDRYSSDEDEEELATRENEEISPEDHSWEKDF